ncbi:unnamed protein product [Durusdinium trenchii]
MGCNGSTVEMPSGYEESSVIAWPNAQDAKDVSIRMEEPRLSFHSMEDLKMDAESSKHLPPMRTTYERHMARLEQFLKKVDQEKLNQAVRSKRIVHKARQEMRWGKQATCAPGSLVETYA